MTFNQTFQKLLSRFTLLEAEGMPPAAPTGKQENPAGTDANPQGPQPDATQNVEPTDPFELTFANFVLALTKLKNRDVRITNMPIEQIELNLERQGSNPNAVKQFLKSIVRRFAQTMGVDVRQLNYSDPKFGEKLGSSQKMLAWAYRIVFVIRNLKNAQSTNNVELANYSEITTENLENFIKALDSLSATK